MLGQEEAEKHEELWNAEKAVISISSMAEGVYQKLAENLGSLAET
jgi:hypothetical protein